jgi:hypothetical protein
LADDCSVAGDEATLLVEPVSLDSIGYFAALRGAAHFRIEVGGRQMTLRKACAIFALRTMRPMPYREVPAVEGDGALTAAWFECDPDRKLRRYSGCTELDENAPYAKVFERLVEFGVGSFMATCSAFAGPRIFRHIVRNGVVGLDLDQSKSAVRAMAHRHPEAFHLQRYIEHPESYHAGLSGTEDEKKALFRAFLCGGGNALLLKNTAAHNGTVPELVYLFMNHCRMCMKVDCARNPELLQELRDRGKRFPEATLVSILNMQFEREHLDAVVQKLEASGVVAIASFEHDGVYVMPKVRLGTAVMEWFQKVYRLAKEACPFIEIKSSLSKEEILERLRGKATEQKYDWDTVDPEWFKDVVRAGQGGVPGEGENRR